MARFVETPDAAIAGNILDQGGFLWNSRMFLLRASVCLKELERFAPEIYATCCVAGEGDVTDGAFCRPDAAAFLALPSASLDYAVMDSRTLRPCFAMATGRSDLGSWEALYKAEQRDDKGDVCHADIMIQDVENCYFNAQHPLLIGIDMPHIVAVKTSDAVLVASHEHRAAHWVVVNGTTKVTNGDKVRLFSKNQAAYIAIGRKRRLKNPGVIALVLIEIQLAAYLGEDDIVHFADAYGREEITGRS